MMINTLRINASINNKFINILKNPIFEMFILYMISKWIQNIEHVEQDNNSIALKLLRKFNNTSSNLSLFFFINNEFLFQ